MRTKEEIKEAVTYYINNYGAWFQMQPQEIQLNLVNTYWDLKKS